MVIHSSRGFSLIELAVATLVGGLVIFLLYSGIGFAQKLFKREQLKGEVENLRNLIRLSVSCDKTAPPLNGCTNDTYVPVYAKTGMIFLPAAGGVINGLTVRVKVAGCPLGPVYQLHFEYRNKTLGASNEHWAPLFKIPFECPKL